MSNNTVESGPAASLNDSVNVSPIVHNDDLLFDDDIRNEPITTHIDPVHIKYCYSDDDVPQWVAASNIPVSMEIEGIRVLVFSRRCLIGALGLRQFKKIFRRELKVEKDKVLARTRHRRFL